MTLRRFSVDWHTWTRHGLPGNSCLSNLEDYVSKWDRVISRLQPLPPVSDYSELARCALNSPSDALRFVLRNADYLRRIVMIRSERLATGFAESFNTDNYTAAPVLLRALLEEGARGLYSAELYRGLLPVIKSKPTTESMKDILRPLIGSRANAEAVAARMATFPLDSLAPAQYAVLKFEEFWNDAAESHWNPKTKSGDPSVLETANVLTMLEGAEKFIEIDSKTGLRPVDNPLLLVYAWLSDMSHPSNDSWTLIYDKVIEGGSHALTQESLNDLRSEAAGGLLQVAETFVYPLPLHAFANLSSLMAKADLT
jgi:hypothetical protein